MSVKPAARTCRSNVSAWRHFLLKPDRRPECARARALAGVSHSSGRYSSRPEKPGAHAGPQRHRRRDLAIGDLAERATVLARDADRVRALFRKAGPVEDQDAAPFRNHRAQPTPDRSRVPRRVRNEVLEGLIRDRLGHARQHRLHRLALAVAEDPLHVRPQRHQLRAMAEAALELLEPAHQALDARRRRLVDHRAAPYQTMTKSTMSSIQITCETRTNQRSDKVELGRRY